MFVKGLTQGATKCIADPSTDGGGTVLGVVVLLATVGLYVGLVVDMIRFRRRTRAEAIKWAAAKPKTKPEECADPLMRTRGALQLRLASKGWLCFKRLKADAVKDRASGAFDMSALAEESKEPARTERLLARPFALTHKSVVDQFHARAGTMFFRVNAASKIGVGWRMIVIGATMTIGFLCGLGVAIKPGSVGGILQTALVWILQVTLGVLCFTFSPDADKVFSAIAGAQFLAEGLSNMLLFFAAFADYDGWKALTSAAFNLSLVGVVVPIVQLLEQRLVTPILKAIYTHGCNPTALAGALLVLLVSLPGAVLKAIKALCGGGGGGGGGGGPDVSKIGKGLATLLGRSAASGDAGGKKVSLPSRKPKEKSTTHEKLGSSKELPKVQQV